MFLGLARRNNQVSRRTLHFKESDALTSNSLIRRRTGAEINTRFDFKLFSSMEFLSSGKSFMSSKIHICKSSVQHQIVCEEHSSLLSLCEAESVCSHPILKFIDFTQSPTQVKFSLGMTDSRILASLRLCHKFDFGCRFIRYHMTTFSPPALLESARLLADAELHKRCASRSHCYKNDLDIVGLARDLYERVNRSRLPPAMAFTTNTLLGCVIDPIRTISEFSRNNVKNMIHREDVHYHLSCIALDNEQWDQFRIIMSSCPLSPHCSPLLVFNIIDFATRNPSERNKVIRWYFGALSVERMALIPVQWSKYALNLIRVCGWKADSVNITKHGEIEGCVEEMKLSVPKEKALDLDQFNCLKMGINSMLTGLSKDSGSVTKKELATLRQSIRSWSREGARAVVIDSLNVYHGTMNGFGSLVRMTNRLASEYENAVVVTRPFLFERLKSVRWRGNVHIFSCTTLSEDDLLVLLAAVEWGPNAFVLSNDRFEIHAERANATERIFMREWMRRRILRFNKHGWQYDCIPEYGEFVQQIASSTFFVPVSEQTAGIPLRSAFVVRDQSPNAAS